MTGARKHTEEGGECTEAICASNLPAGTEDGDDESAVQDVRWSCSQVEPSRGFYGRDSPLAIDLAQP